MTEKCATLDMKKGREVKNDGIEMPNVKLSKSLDEGECYGYFGVLHADEVMTG